MKHPTFRFAPTSTLGDKDNKKKERKIIMLKELVNASMACQLLNMAKDQAGETYQASSPVGNIHLDRIVEEQIEQFKSKLIEEIRSIEPLAFTYL